MVRVVPHVGPSCTPPWSRLCLTLVRVVPHPDRVSLSTLPFANNLNCTTSNVIAKSFGDHQLTKLLVSRTGDLLLERFLQRHQLRHQLLPSRITQCSLSWNGWSALPPWLPALLTITDRSRSFCLIGFRLPHRLLLSNAGLFPRSFKPPFGDCIYDHDYVWCYLQFFIPGSICWMVQAHFLVSIQLDSEHRRIPSTIASSARLISITR